MKNTSAYRCPVCSYNDNVSFEPNAVMAEIDCRYCETPLLLIRPGEDQLQAEAAVRVTSTPC